MQNSQMQQNPKHIKGFWPIFTIVIVAAVAAGLVLFYVSGNVTQDDLNSMNFFHRTEPLKTPVKKPLMQTPNTLK